MTEDFEFGSRNAEVGKGNWEVGRRKKRLVEGRWKMTENRRQRVDDGNDEHNLSPIWP